LFLAVSLGLASAPSSADAGPLRWAAKAAKASKGAKVGGAAAKTGGAAAKAAMGAKAVVAGGVAYTVARGGRVFAGMSSELADGALLVTRSSEGGFLGITRGAREARVIDDLRFASDAAPDRVLMDPGVALDRASVDALGDVELHVVDGAGRVHPVRKSDDGDHWIVEVKDKVQDLAEFAVEAVGEGYEDDDAKQPWVLPLVDCAEQAASELDWRIPAGATLTVDGAKQWLAEMASQRVLVIGRTGAELDPVLVAGASEGHRMILAQLDDPCGTGLDTINARVESAMASPMPLRSNSTLAAVSVLGSDPLVAAANVVEGPAIPGLTRIGWSFPSTDGAGFDSGRPIHLAWWSVLISWVLLMAMAWYLPPFRWIIRPSARWIGRKVREARSADAAEA
jgi:hypothetical protein